MRFRDKPLPKFRRKTVVSEDAELSLSKRDAFFLKNEAFLLGAYQAWFTTALEQTKAVFALASAGVGLCLTLLFSENVQPLESWAPVWLLLGAVSFAMASGLSVAVFGLNKQVLGRLLGDSDSSPDEGLVGRLDFAARLCFGAGLVFLIFSSTSQIWL